MFLRAIPDRWWRIWMLVLVKWNVDEWWWMCSNQCLMDIPYKLVRWSYWGDSLLLTCSRTSVQSLPWLCRWRIPAGFFYDPSSPDLCPTLEDGDSHPMCATSTCWLVLDSFGVPPLVLLSFAWERPVRVDDSYDPALFFKSFSSCLWQIQSFFHQRHSLEAKLSNTYQSSSSTASQRAMPCRACRARAAGCTFDHDQHVCAACGDQDSDHCFRDCEQRHHMNLFHGTHKNNVDGILADGLKESRGGNLGQGVYFVHDFKIAKSIAEGKYRANWAVIECKVDLGKCLSLYENSAPDLAGEWRTRYDSVFRRHCSWHFEKEFREFNVKQGQIKMMQAYEDEHGKLVSKKPPVTCFGRVVSRLFRCCGRRRRGSIVKQGQVKVRQAIPVDPQGVVVSTKRSWFGLLKELGLWTLWTLWTLWPWGLGVIGVLYFSEVIEFLDTLLY